MHPVSDLQEEALNHLLMHFTRNGAFGPERQELVVLERGEGPYVFDTNGNRYFDALSALFCSQLGYSYGEELAAAAAEQMATLPFATTWSFAHPAAVRLAERLSQLAPPGLGHVFFTSGGAESVESAWKLVRLHHNATGGERRTKAIARRVAYHGASLGALALTGVDGYKAPFAPPAIHVRHVSPTNPFRLTEDERFGDAIAHDDAAFSSALLKEIEEVVLKEGPETIAMFIAEPVQNAGGCFVPPAGYWEGLRELADRYGFLLVADEVITAFGRLGEWFGSTRVGAQPDLITTAKGLTSAYAPMGAVFASDRVVAPLYEDPKRSLVHGITFGGHPLCAAISLKNLEIFERDGVFENVRGLERHLEERLRELLSLPIVGDVRGAGFFWAVELVGENNRRFDADERERLLRGFLFGRLLKAGMIARPDDRGDSVVQVAPPLISTAEQLDEMVDSLAEVLVEAGELMNVGSGAAERV